MLLAMDVGNTSVTVGIFLGRRILARGRIPTHGSPPLGPGPSLYRKALQSFLRKSRVPLGEIEGVIVSSVVPRATVTLKKALKSLLKSTRRKRSLGIRAPKIFILGENIEAPVVNRYRIPAQVGQDRLVNAAAASSLYGGPAIVVDFGTAITVDLVNRRREYLGGMIAPGIEISLEALASRAALLPRVKLAPPTELLGRETVDSMRSGIFYGFSALCDGLVTRLKAKHAPKAKVIATGGYARLIAPYCRSVQIVNPDLTLQGLELTFRKICLTFSSKSV